jgi:TP901 family phage tail tape measure protein
MSLAVTAPLAILGGLGVRAFSDFDQAMTESTSIMQVTNKQMERMKELALELSAEGTVLQAPKDLAESYFFLASAGKDAEQAMALLPQVATFATAGAFDMALATDLLTDAQSALGLTSKDVAKDMESLTLVGDTLVKANTLANASVQQFSTALTTKAGAAIKAYNIDLNEGVALLAAYADQGIKAELAGNAVDRMLRLLTKASRENASAFEALNVRVFDSQGEFRTFQEIIGDLERATQHLSTEQKAAALEMLGFEARVQAVILPLLGTSKALGRYSKELDNVGGVMQDVAKKQMESFRNQMTDLLNLIKVAGVELGEVLAPTLIRVAQGVGRLVDKWRTLEDNTKRLVVAFAALAAAMGPVLVAMGSMITLAGFTLQGFATLIGAIRAVGVAYTAMGAKAAAAWAAATLGASLAVTGIVLGLGKLQKEFGVFDPLLETFKSVAREFKTNLNPIFNRVKQNVLELSRVMASAFKSLVPVIEILAKGLETSLNKQLESTAAILKPILLVQAEILKTQAKLAEGEGGTFGKIISGIPFGAIGVAGALAPEKDPGGEDVVRDVRHAELRALAKEMEQNGSIMERALSEVVIGTARGVNEVEAALGSRLPGTLESLGSSFTSMSRKALMGLKELREKGGVKEFQDDVDKLTEKLQEQVATFGMNSAEVEIFRLKMQGATPEMLKAAEAANKQLKALGETQKLMERGRGITQRFLTPLEKFKETQKDLEKLREVGAIDENTFKRALEAANEELERAQQGVRKLRQELKMLREAPVLDVGSAEAFRALSQLPARASRAPTPVSPKVLDQQTKKQLGVEGEGEKKMAKDIDRSKQALVSIETVIQEMQEGLSAFAVKDADI